ncbi:MAG TPA: 3-mercaptopyruvate sulfurtransferase [Azospirillum sp.]
MAATLPGPLVSTEWLAANLNAGNVKVVDATWGMPGSGLDPLADFADEHIPGAVFFDIDAMAKPDTGPLPHMVPDADDFAAKVGALGIGNDDIVVAYDTHGLQTAARAWWLFRAFGHDKVAVLDGGLPQWLEEQRPVEGGTPSPAPKTFTAAPRPELVRSADEVRANIAARGFQLVDARSQPRFEGTIDDPWAGRRRGHIPGSRNLPFSDLLDPVSKMFLPESRMREVVAKAGVDLDKPIVATCGSGVTACVLALGFQMLGRPDVPVYDGSWAEWGLPGDRPVETGPAA